METTYAKKTEIADLPTKAFLETTYATKQYVDEHAGGSSTYNVEVVKALPDSPNANTIYYVIG